MILSISLIVVIIINGFLAFGFIKRDRVIDKYFLRTIGLSRSHISRAYSNVEAASWAIDRYDTYYNFKAKDNSHRLGILYSDEFFRCYIYVAEEWATALLRDDVENIPTDKEIQNYLSDMRALADAFSIFYSESSSEYIHIEDLEPSELRDIFDRLAENTKTERVKVYLDSIYFRH